MLAEVSFFFCFLGGEMNERKAGPQNESEISIAHRSESIFHWLRLILSSWFLKLNNHRQFTSFPLSKPKG